MSGIVTWTAFGERLRSARLSRGLSMRALASAAGVSAPYVNELEKGRSRAGLDVVGHLAEALQIPVYDLASLLEYRLPDSALEIQGSIGTDITPEEARQLRQHLEAIRARQGPG